MNTDQQFNLKQTLTAYKMQQAENLRNMDNFAYNKVYNGIEYFGNNEVTENEVVVDNEPDNTSEELVITLDTENDTLPETTKNNFNSYTNEDVQNNYLQQTINNLAASRKFK